MDLRISRKSGMKLLSIGGAVSVWSATTSGPKKCYLQYYSIGRALGFFGNGIPSPFRLNIYNSKQRGVRLGYAAKYGIQCIR